MQINGKTYRWIFFLCILLCLPIQVSLAQKKAFTVVIDAGHGGKDSGAVGITTKEKEITLPVALELGHLIKQNHNDVNVLYTRQKDVFVALDKRAEIANKAHADLFISIHCNALDRKKKSPQGVETFVLGLHRSKDNLDVAKAENAVIFYEDDYSTKYDGFNPHEPESYIIFEFMANQFLEQSVYLASLVQNKMVHHSKRVNRNVRQAGFLVLREVAMPSILIELGYITNHQDEQFLRTVSGQQSIAKSIYLGFKEYKREYDKKSYVFTKDKISNSIDQPQSLSDGATVSSRGRVEYRVQFLTSSKYYAPNSSAFKGLTPVSHYRVGRLYKYTYGSTTDKREIEEILRQVRKNFRDAFIIEYKDGKRIK